MKKFTFKMMMLAAVAMFAGTAVAQTSTWKGTTDGPYVGNGAATYSPVIDYSITYEAVSTSLTAEFTFSDVLDVVGFNPQVRLGATTGFQPLTLVSGTTYRYSTTVDTPVGETMQITVLFAWPENASETTFEYVVGSDNQVADEEAPILTKAELAGFTYNVATLTVAATDNTGNVVVEVYEDEACETLLASQSIVADGSDQTVEVTGLTAETAYTFYVKAKDGAGNYSSEVLQVEATTAEAPDLQEAVWYGVINNDTQWNMGTIGTTGYTPIINYTVTTTVENQLRFHITLSEAFVASPEVWYIVDNSQTGPVPMNKVSETEFDVTVLESMQYERGKSLLFRFRFPMDGGAPETQNIEFVIGAENEAPAADEEAPVLTAATVGEVGDKTAVLNVTVTDNSGVAIITVSGDNFEAAEYTVTADGTAQTVELEGLTPETYYKLTVGAKDIAGNVADNVISIDFTTTQEVIYEEVTVTGHVSSDKSEWDPGCQTAEYFPAFSYKVTTKGDNTLAFEVTMDDADYDYAGVARAFVKGGSFELACAEGAKVYTGVTTQSYERGSTVDVYFRFIPVGSAEVWTLPFYVEIGEEVEAGVAGLQTGNVAIYAANGNLTVAGAEGETVRVYAVSGALVYEAVASGNESISLEKGIYIVVAGKTVKKIVL